MQMALNYICQKHIVAIKISTVHHGNVHKGFCQSQENKAGAHGSTTFHKSKRNASSKRKYLKLKILEITFSASDVVGCLSRINSFSVVSM